MFSSVKTKTNANFSVKLAGRSNHSFLLSIWWITFFKHLYSQYAIIQCIIELNLLCKHIKKVRSSQPAISCTELNKTQFSPLTVYTNVVSSASISNFGLGVKIGTFSSSFKSKERNCWLKETEVSLPCVQMLLAVLVLLNLMLGVKIGTFSSSFKREERISTRGESLWDND